MIEMNSRKVQSPFAGEEANVQVRTSHAFSQPWMLAVLVVGALLLGIGGTLFVPGMLKGDSRQGLSSFPVSEYLADYRPYEGSRFAAELKVESDLGFKGGWGRLMLFSLGEDKRPVAVRVSGESPTKGQAGGITRETMVFQKGQVYSAVVRVGEGGLLSAEELRKR